jgi:hypothetical protein
MNNPSIHEPQDALTQETGASIHAFHLMTWVERAKGAPSDAKEGGWKRIDHIFG